MKSYYFVLLFVLLFISCNNNSVEPVNNNSFSLELQVIDSNGNVLPNVNVSIWSTINYNHNLNKVSSSNNIQSATDLGYNLIQSCFVDISVYNLNGEKKKSLVFGQYNAGAYSSQLSMHEIIGTGVYRCKMIASTDSLMKNILFQDSIYVVLWQPDPEYSLVGKTNLLGKLTITDKSLFPVFNNLPPITHTTYTPDSIGTFTFSNEITIALSNGTFTKSQSFNKTIKDGINSYTLNLTTSLSKSDESNIYKKKPESHRLINKLSSIPNKWRLSQNYPNPFN